EGGSPMKRAYVLGAVVAVGMAVTAAAAVSAQQPAQGQGGGRGGGGGNFPPVQPIAKVADNLYKITGQGGTTVAYVAQNGVVLVDTKLANNGQAILDQVK